MSKQLAVNGGSKAVEEFKSELCIWPIVTDEDRAAIVKVLDECSMSATVITKEFEKEYAAWIGVKYALGYCNGTSALHAAMWACGVGAGDEIICPSMTYWASCTAALSLGAAVNFADIDPDTLCIDPEDIEHRIGPKTKAIVVVHYSGYPADMDRIMEIAGRHGVKVIEDASHSHGSMYKGRHTGTIGDICGMSMMSGKAFAIGEAGLVTTNDRSLYERCIAFGHYERTGAASNFNAVDAQVTDSELQKFAGIPLGGYKHRMNQWCSAMGKVQLKHYPARIAEIDKAMNYFCDLLDAVPGLKTHRPPAGSGLTKGGWYHPVCHYNPEELKNVPIETFCKAVTAEGVKCNPGINFPLHLHKIFHEADIFNMGKPTMISFGQRDVRQGPGTLPVSEASGRRNFTIPKFTTYDKTEIEKVAAAFKKVADNIDELI
ncbi:MAG: DegT/DnrJ/EryC1/StrS family aminotransferase [Victivallaceae bacterium]|nr:DegT/DnrJ/EryC1/StrS family aminotransferase [Victivallaceae bacterium]